MLSTSGAFKAYVVSNDGGEQVIGFYLPGALLGLDGFGNNQYLSSAIALRKSTVCELPKSKLETMCRKIDGLHEKMHHFVSEEVIHDQTTLLLLGKRSVEERLAAFILSLSEQLNRGGLQAVDVNLPMSRQEMGNYLGLAVETVSRLFTKMHDEGFIEVQNRHIKISDIDMLRKMVSECCIGRFSN